MADLSNPDSLLPDDAKLAVIRQAVAEYNQGRPAVARSHAIQYPAIITIYVVVAAGVLLMLYLNNQDTFLVFAAAGAVYFFTHVSRIADEPRANYQLALRSRLLPVIFSFIEKFRFEHRQDSYTLKILRDSKLIGFSIGETQDCISGIHAGKPFDLVEAKLETGGKNSTVVFEGVIVKFDRAGFFSGTLQARRKANAVDGFVRSLFGFDANIYECGNPVIDATHEFYTDNPAQAARLMFEPLAKAIDYLQSNWRDGRVLIGFRNHEVFLLLPTKRNLFELPDIKTDVDFSGTVMPMLRDMVMVLATIDLVAKVGETD